MREQNMNSSLKKDSPESIQTLLDEIETEIHEIENCLREVALLNEIFAIRILQKVLLAVGAAERVEKKRVNKKQRSEEFLQERLSHLQETRQSLLLDFYAAKGDAQAKAYTENRETLEQIISLLNDIFDASFKINLRVVDEKYKILTFVRFTDVSASKELLALSEHLNQAINPQWKSYMKIEYVHELSQLVSAVTKAMKIYKIDES